MLQSEISNVFESDLLTVVVVDSVWYDADVLFFWGIAKSFLLREYLDLHGCHNILV